MAKAITKLEHRVWDLSEKLPALTKKHIDFGKENSFWPSFSISRNKIHCLECGTKFEGNLKKKRHKCSCCNKTLRKTYNETWVRHQGYLMVIDRIEEFQVLRYLYINKWMKKGQSPRFDHLEVSRVFIRPDGKVTVMGIHRNSMGSGYYSPQWVRGSDFSIKRHNNRFYRNRYTEHYSALYPSFKIIPELRRNGFKRSFLKLNPVEMMHSLLISPKLETLLKRNNIKLFQEGVMYPKSIENYWNELKITFRNNYEIEDSGIWRDYIDLLRYFEKDTLNPVFACPEDLNTAHNKWMEKKRKVIERENRIRREKEAEERRQKEEYWKIHYPLIRQAFLDFSIKHEHITIEIIKSVEQLKEESEILYHCAYTNGYYDKETSLLLSARVNGVVTETIEINLERMVVIQSRGYDNKASKHNAQIVKLINKSLPKIHKLYKKQLKLSA